MATVQTIRRNRRNPVNDTLGAIGQGISGFTGGYMGGEQLKMARQQQQATQRLMDRMFGGGGISAGAQPGTESAAPSLPAMQPTQAQPSPEVPQMTGAAPMNSAWLDQMMRGGMGMGMGMGGGGFDIPVRW